MKYLDWKAHSKMMDDFLDYLYSQTDRFVFKGGSALYKFYGLDRFSEDLDFDSEKGNITNIVKNFCKTRKLSQPKERKDTNKGQKHFIDYGIKGQTLKIETSLRNKNIDTKMIRHFGKYKVYDINVLASQKIDAYRNRDKIRDLYDVCFIVIHHLDKLLPEIQDELNYAISQKGIQQYDYVIKEQNDEFIDKDKLQDMVLQTFEKLKLLK
jgi:predicted nucleotidyltransferase component of viral defense system